MSNEAPEPVVGSEPEIQAPPPEELVNKILALRAKGDAKNNPKKPKAPAVPRPSRAVVDAPIMEEMAPSTLPREVEKLIEQRGPIAAPRLESKKVELALDSNGKKLDEISARVGDLSQQISGVQEHFGEQNVGRDKAFDLLYEELSGYKNDFFYERLKPTLRSLLFLLDSIEEFEREIESQEEKGEAMPGEIIKANLTHFRDQLVDALFMSETAPIEATDDKFNAKTQRAVQVVKVEADKNNTVQRQIRGGWTVGGKILRPADVVVGKSDEASKNKGNS